jgi:CheY-like chemotaxis protein
MNMLVVDDDPTLRFILQNALTKLGHSVALAKDGVEALKAFETCHVPVVISDMLMPGMDGLELCRRIRKADRSQYTYIILRRHTDATFTHSYCPDCFKKLLSEIEGAGPVETPDKVGA